MSRGGHGIADAIRQSNDDAKEVSASVGPALHVVYRTFAFRFRTSNERLGKTNLLDFFRFDAMSCDVLDTIFGPDEVVNCHPEIL